MNEPEVSVAPFTNERVGRSQPSRALRVLGSCNRTLLRALSERELLEEICRLLVQSGGYHFAFIAYCQNDETQKLIPVANAGVEEGYLEAVRITWDKSPHGNGPGGTAFRTGLPCVVQDVGNDPGFAPWREEAQKRGYGSVISLPFLDDGTPFGILSIVAKEPYAFDDLEAELLGDFSLNLSYAITALRMREQREKARIAFSRQSRQLRALAARLQAAREEERTIVARELHDELGQTLTALKLDLAWIRSKLHDDEALIGRLDSSVALVTRAIGWMRKTCTELRPGVLDDLGLAAAIEWQAGEFESHSGIHVQVRVPESEPVLSGDQSTALFRILQEALTNVARHSRAGAVEVSLHVKDGLLTLAVNDDGVGFAGDMLSKKNSFGLLGMRERALVLGGELRITSAPNQGTKISVSIPVQTDRKVDQREHAHPDRG